MQNSTLYSSEKKLIFLLDGLRKFPKMLYCFLFKKLLKLYWARFYGKIHPRCYIKPILCLPNVFCPQLWRCVVLQTYPRAEAGNGPDIWRLLQPQPARPLQRPRQHADAPRQVHTKDDTEESALSLCWHIAHLYVHNHARKEKHTFKQLKDFDIKVLTASL